jgi:hypothetical protein
MCLFIGLLLFLEWNCNSIAKDTANFEKSLKKLYQVIHNFQLKIKFHVDSSITVSLKIPISKFIETNHY